MSAALSADFRLPTLPTLPTGRHPGQCDIRTAHEIRIQHQRGRQNRQCRQHFRERHIDTRVHAYSQHANESAIALSHYISPSLLPTLPTLPTIQVFRGFGRRQRSSRTAHCCLLLRPFRSGPEIGLTISADCSKRRVRPTIAGAGTRARGPPPKTSSRGRRRPAPLRTRPPP